MTSVQITLAVLGFILWTFVVFLLGYFVGYLGHQRVVLDQGKYDDVHSPFNRKEKSN